MVRSLNLLELERKATTRTLKTRKAKRKKIIDCSINNTENLDSLKELFGEKKKSMQNSNFISIDQETNTVKIKSVKHTVKVKRECVTTKFKSNHASEVNESDRDRDSKAARGRLETKGILNRISTIRKQEQRDKRRERDETEKIDRIEALILKENEAIINDIKKSSKFNPSQNMPSPNSGDLATGKPH